MAWDIVKKIKAMVAKAESTSSLEEAETIMVMVHKMLQEHGLTLLSIRHTVDSDDPVEVEKEVFGFWKAENWMRKLSHAVSLYYGVTVVWTAEGNYTHITAVGRESCRAAFVVMLPYLKLRVKRMAADGWRNHRYPSASKAQTQIGLALAHRLYALAAEAKRRPTTPREAAGMNMLVPVDAVKIELERAFPNAREIKTKSRVRINREAVADAASINLNDQLKDPAFQKKISY